VKRKRSSQPKGIVVRAGTRHDVAVIAQLIHGLAEYERLANECRVTPQRLLRDGFGRRRYFDILAATRWAGGKEHVLGFALYFFTYSTFAACPTLYLEDLFVTETERRAGIGGALLQALARIALQTGCGRMEWAVLDWNKPAIAFYDSLGAKLRKQWVPTALEGAPLRRLAERR
jgi:GNAT superfamily N-acetyltransferase